MVLAREYQYDMFVFARMCDMHAQSFCLISNPSHFICLIIFSGRVAESAASGSHVCFVVAVVEYPRHDSTLFKPSRQCIRLKRKELASSRPLS